MKYELNLKGNKKIILTKEEADSLSQGIMAKQEAFKVGENVFKRSWIDGILPIKEEIADNKEQWLKENKEWHDTCLRMSRMSFDDKVTTELINRIIPGLELNKIKLTDEQLAVMELNIRQFFQDNPKYPRCPLRILWPFIKENVAPIDEETKKRNTKFLTMNKWWNYVLRNDSAIEDWMKYQN